MATPGPAANYQMLASVGKQVHSKHREAPQPSFSKVRTCRRGRHAPCQPAPPMYPASLPYPFLQTVFSSFTVSALPFPSFPFVHVSHPDLPYPISSSPSNLVAISALPFPSFADLST